LQTFIDTEFASEVHEVHQGVTSIRKVLQEIAKGEKVLKEIQNIPTLSSFGDSRQLEQETEWLKRVRAAILSLPQYLQEKEQQPAIERNNLKKEQMAWTNKFGTFASFFAGPAFGNLFTVLVQYIFNFLGSKRELPLQENAPAALFVNNTLHQVKK
jgi:hypothetical protein